MALDGTYRRTERANAPPDKVGALPLSRKRSGATRTLRRCCSRLDAASPGTRSRSATGCVSPQSRRLAALLPMATATARAPSDRQLARADLVPMHRTQRVRPSGASVGRPRQASAEGRLETPAGRAQTSSPSRHAAGGGRPRLSCILSAGGREALLVAPGRKPPALRRRLVAFLSANDERDAREVDGSRVVRQKLGERPGGESCRPDRVRISGARSVKVTVSLSVPTDRALCRSYRPPRSARSRSSIT